MNTKTIVLPACTAVPLVPHIQKELHIHIVAGPEELHIHLVAGPVHKLLHM